MGREKNTGREVVFTDIGLKRPWTGELTETQALELDQWLNRGACLEDVPGTIMMAWQVCFLFGAPWVNWVIGQQYVCSVSKTGVRSWSMTMAVFPESLKAYWVSLIEVGGVPAGKDRS